jgi:nitroimidazol reductase NimA-like FMN-containing flavoprotein (pyridoxamine 5'-phosphate oxidase superfamily)
MLRPRERERNRPWQTGPVAAEPIAEPMPWPGYAPEGAGDALLAWTWAVERLAAARTYWLATTHAAGTSHLRPVWAVWSEGRLAFSTGRGTRKARNLARTPRCSVALREADGAVVVDGVAGEVVDAAARARIDAAYTAKYGSSMLIGESPVFAIRPTSVIGIGEAGGGSPRPTRWRLS